MALANAARFAARPTGPDHGPPSVPSGTVCVLGIMLGMTVAATRGTPRRSATFSAAICAGGSPPRRHQQWRRRGRGSSTPRRTLRVVRGSVRGCSRNTIETLEEPSQLALHPPSARSSKDHARAPQHKGLVARSDQRSPRHRFEHEGDALTPAADLGLINNAGAGDVRDVRGDLPRPAARAIRRPACSHVLRQDAERCHGVRRHRVGARRSCGHRRTRRTRRQAIARQFVDSLRRHQVEALSEAST